MNLPEKNFFLVVISLALLTGIGSIFLNKAPDADRLKSKTFKLLAKELDTKRDKAISYLKVQESSAMKVVSDQNITELFVELNTLFLSGETSSHRAFLLDQQLQEYFVNRLGQFYDMLFINKKGDFFYTVKKENDYGKNIGHKQFSGLSLQNNLTNQKFAFIDYEYYSASEEPASFYILPVRIKGEFFGHIVLQLSINMINDIFVDRSNLDRTGEVYLVNQEQLMITDSRFVDTSTVLNKRIDTMAVREARKQGKGKSIIIDYRGKKVFSVFENFRYHGVNWVVVSEIDEDEVLTQYYKEHESSFYPELFTQLITQPDEGRAIPLIRNIDSGYTKVDVKEYVRSNIGIGLYTKGVATCTAVSVQHPERFSYLAHLSPTDASYNDNLLHKYVLGDQYTNYIDVIMRRIKHYDIRPYELASLKFSIAAPDNSAFRGIINRLVNQDVYLNQILIHQKPGQLSMDMVVNNKTGKVSSIWYSSSENSRSAMSVSGINLMTAFKKHIGYQS